LFSAAHESALRESESDIDQMDLAAVLAACAGLLLSAHGRPIEGAILFAVALASLPVVLATASQPPVLLPFSFRSYFVVLTVGVVGAVAWKDLSRVAPIGCLGVAIYYYACVSLREKAARYVPWGAGFAWRTATRSGRPRTYWTMVSFAFALSAVLLGLMLAEVTGWLHRAN